MSRLYGRAFDVFQISKYIKEHEIPKYTENNKKITIDGLIDSSGILGLYLPDSAIDFIKNHPVEICKTPFIPRSMSSFPTQKNPKPVICFKGVNFKEEFKREFIFFLGCLLSEVNPDELPKSKDLPCEYGDLLPLLLEHLYLKENGEEERFLPKHLNALKFNADSYQRVYEDHQKHLVSNRSKELDIMSYKTLSQIEENQAREEKEFLTNTLKLLVPFSSVDGALQIIDKLKTEDEIKDFIKVLYENKNNNRQEIMKDYDIESYGYKRLRRAIDTWRYVK